jgi:hypothetical protein
MHVLKEPQDRKKRKVCSLSEKAKELDKVDRRMRIAAFLHLIV